MAEEKQLEASRMVRAPADQVFALLSDPKQHRAIDGSGYLRGSPSDPVTGVGQVFTMEMYRDDLGPYRTFNTVTDYEPGTAIGWAPDLDPDCALAPKLAGITTGGHRYVYRLRETGDETEVRQIYDWSGVSDPNFEAFCPFVSQEQLMGTLNRLADAAERSTGRAGDDV